MFDPSLLGSERVRAVSRVEYERMVEQGWFGDDERVELLRGTLVEISPQGEPHARIAAWFAQRLSKALPFDHWEVHAHSPFAATADSVPEPDVSVAPRGGRRQRGALLLIEVSDASLRKDRLLKSEIYAEAGVPEYWIVDLASEAVEVLTQPTSDGYRHVERLTTGVLRPAKIRGVSFRLADIPWRPRERRR